MTISVLSLVGAVFAFAVWLIKRQAAKSDSRTPSDIYVETVSKIDREIVDRNGSAAAGRLDEWLRRIRFKGGGGAGG